jgi:hypothetical protein
MKKVYIYLREYIYILLYREAQMGVVAACPSREYRIVL